MLGVTMEDRGVTKVVQIKLDDDMLNGRAVFDDSTEEFVEEEVEPEEGIVLPPRPPRREHNPDGSLKVTQSQPKLEEAKTEEEPAVEQEEQEQAPSQEEKTQDDAQ